eukprot:CAMPEP_0174300278 /NCGR_PEP_ID=MMETSP0809-20121228/58370_1 /TAXON_ID=73025 ORGANISM="Eutreptiella gymnastica-like, Strain CCMP1594" /NCGR_SAMPLE_ID=MMETSP0809 /ASSEMBLY_ACC=CAM_ASM_000658 /LENGTH=893 /DNA_ID=CAMNT_0015405833 /DNA_START=44 /DNA_END=2725 /DNA_ORIENTATION=-
MREDAALHSGDQQCNEPCNDVMEPRNGRRCELQEKVTCPFCNKGFASKVIQQHANACLDGTIVHCPLCDMECDSAEVLDRHFTMYHDSPVPQKDVMQCSYCPQQGASVVAWGHLPSTAQHLLREKHPHVIKGSACNQCVRSARPDGCDLLLSGARSASGTQLQESAEQQPLTQQLGQQPRPLGVLCEMARGIWRSDESISSSNVARPGHEPPERVYQQVEDDMFEADTFEADKEAAAEAVGIEPLEDIRRAQLEDADKRAAEEDARQDEVNRVAEAEAEARSRAQLEEDMKAAEDASGGAAKEQQHDQRAQVGVPYSPRKKRMGVLCEMARGIWRSDESISSSNVARPGHEPPERVYQQVEDDMFEADTFEADKEAAAEAVGIEPLEDIRRAQLEDADKRAAEEDARQDEVNRVAEAEAEARSRAQLEEDMKAAEDASGGAAKEQQHDRRAQVGVPYSPQKKRRLLSVFNAAARQQSPPVVLPEPSMVAARREVASQDAAYIKLDEQFDVRSDVSDDEKGHARGAADEVDMECRKRDWEQNFSHFGKAEERATPAPKAQGAPKPQPRSDFRAHQQIPFEEKAESRKVENDDIQEIRNSSPAIKEDEKWQLPLTDKYEQKRRRREEFDRILHETVLSNADVRQKVMKLISYMGFNKESDVRWLLQIVHHQLPELAQELEACLEADADKWTSILLKCVPPLNSRKRRGSAENSSSNWNRFSDSATVPPPDPAAAAAAAGTVGDGQPRGGHAKRRRVCIQSDDEPHQKCLPRKTMNEQEPVLYGEITQQYGAVLGRLKVERQTAELYWGSEECKRLVNRLVQLKQDWKASQMLWNYVKTDMSVWDFCAFIVVLDKERAKCNKGMLARLKSNEKYAYEEFQNVVQRGFLRRCRWTSQ